VCKVVSSLSLVNTKNPYDFRVVYPNNIWQFSGVFFDIFHHYRNSFHQPVLIGTMVNISLLVHNKNISESSDLLYIATDREK